MNGQNAEASWTPADGGYIATDADQSCGAIYGIGETPEEALSDARDYAPGAFGLVAATRRLLESVEANGGGPSDQRWAVYAQSGDTYHGDLPTDPADVRTIPRGRPGRSSELMSTTYFDESPLYLYRTEAVPEGWLVTWRERSSCSPSPGDPLPPGMAGPFSTLRAAETAVRARVTQDHVESGRRTRAARMVEAES